METDTVSSSVEEPASSVTGENIPGKEDTDSTQVAHPVKELTPSGGENTSVNDDQVVHTDKDLVSSSAGVKSSENGDRDPADGKPSNADISKEPQVVRLTVDESTLKYLCRNKNYSSEFDRIKSEFGVTVERDEQKTDILILKGQDEDALKHAETEMKKLIEGISTVTLQPLESDIYASVNDLLEQNQDDIIHAVGEQNVISLTGKTKEVEQCLGQLEEMYGVSMSVSSVSETGTGSGKQPVQPDRSNSTSEQPSDKLSQDGYGQDELDKELYNQTEEFVELEDDALIVNEKVWRYLEKHSEYSVDLKKIKDKCAMNSLPEGSSGPGTSEGRVRLVFTGSDEASVHSAMHETKSIIEKCQSAGTKTVRIPCPEAAVHQKITKLLKAINRLPSYVSVDPEVVIVTGAQLEIDHCLEKLKTYGLVVPTPPPVEIKPEEPKERPAQMDALPTQPRPEGNSAYGSYEHYRQLPAPVEEFLWLYIDARCKQQLTDLQRSFNLEIIVDKAGSQDFVEITLGSDSSEMLDCGQDAIISLIEQFRDQIMIVALNTASQEELPQELEVMLQRQCQGLESVITVKGSNICIIGPGHEATKCQQIVTTAMQKLVTDARSLGYDPSKFEQALMSGENALYQDQGGNMHMGHGHGAGGNMHMGHGHGAGGNMHMGHGHRAGDYEETSNSGRNSEFLRQTHASDFSQVSDFQSAQSPRELPPGLGAKQDVADRSHAHSSAKSETPVSAYEEKTSQPKRAESPRRAQSSGKAQQDTGIDGASSKGGDCSICHFSSSTASDKSCAHLYCMSCVRQYFSDRECPACELTQLGKGVVTQPKDGVMILTYDNSFKLPGFENNSRGTIIVTYAFSSGLQSDDLSSPGSHYSGLTISSYFPMSAEGSKVVDLLHKAFEKRITFKISERNDETKGKLVWNGILHKVNIFGGPQQSGYPDPGYLQRVCNELALRGITDA